MRNQLPLTLTVPEAADLLRISRNSAYEGVRRGEIPAIRIGRRLVVPTNTLLKLVGIDETDPAWVAPEEEGGLVAEEPTNESITEAK